MSQFSMTCDEAFNQARDFASSGAGPQAVLQKGERFDEIYTTIPPATLMEWLEGADAFWFVRPPRGEQSGPFGDALDWINSKPRLLGFEKWQLHEAGAKKVMAIYGQGIAIYEGAEISMRPIVDYVAYDMATWERLDNRGQDFSPVTDRGFRHNMNLWRMFKKSKNKASMATVVSRTGWTGSVAALVHWLWVPRDVDPGCEVLQIWDLWAPAPQYFHWVVEE